MSEDKVCSEEAKLNKKEAKLNKRKKKNSLSSLHTKNMHVNLITVLWIYFFYIFFLY